jgi:hypothetical protein
MARVVTASAWLSTWSGWSRADLIRNLPAVTVPTLVVGAMAIRTSSEPRAGALEGSHQQRTSHTVCGRGKCPSSEQLRQAEPWRFLKQLTNRTGRCRLPRALQAAARMFSLGTSNFLGVQSDPNRARFSELALACAQKVFDVDDLSYVRQLVPLGLRPSDRERDLCGPTTRHAHG